MVSADRGIGGVRPVAPPTWLVSNFLANHLILCHLCFLPLSIFLSIRVFFNESALHMGGNRASRPGPRALARSSLLSSPLPLLASVSGPGRGRQLVYKEREWAASCLTWRGGRGSPNT